MTSPSPELQRSVVYRGADAASRLARMGLSPSPLLAAVARGDEKRRLCSPLHPKTFPGQVMWAETTEALRRTLIPLQFGWAPGSTANYETVFSERVGVGIAVAGGDAFTGVDGFRSPSFSRRKGPLTHVRLRRNRSTVEPTLDGFPEDDSLEDSLQTWFLLCNAREGKIFVELSFLTLIGEDGKPNVWPERILLEPLDSADAVTPAPLTEPDPPQDIPAVLVARRQ